MAEGLVPAEGSGGIGGSAEPHGTVVATRAVMGRRGLGRAEDRPPFVGRENPPSPDTHLKQFRGVGFLTGENDGGGGVCRALEAPPAVIRGWDAADEAS